MPGRPPRSNHSFSGAEYRSDDCRVCTEAVLVRTPGALLTGECSNNCADHVDDRSIERGERPVLNEPLKRARSPMHELSLDRSSNRAAKTGKIATLTGRSWLDRTFSMQTVRSIRKYPTDWPTGHFGITTNSTAADATPTKSSQLALRPARSIGSRAGARRYSHHSARPTTSRSWTSPRNTRMPVGMSESSKSKSGWWQPGVSSPGLPAPRKKYAPGTARAR